MTKEERKIIKQIPHRILNGEAVLKYIDPGPGYHCEQDWEVLMDGVKYVVNIFIDGTLENEDYDYIDHIEFPDGRRIEFEELADSGLDFISYRNDSNNYEFHDMENVKRYFTKAYKRVS